MLNSFIKKLIQKIIDIVAPPGAIMMYGGSQVPEGWILIQNVKVYEDELPRLYLVLAACPELEKGQDEDERKWVKMVNPDGRVPQFTTSGSLVWKLLEAQLPNIIGTHRARSETWFGDISATGAFYAHEDTSDHRIVDVSSGSGRTSIGLNASLANSIYTGDKLQVASLQALACIKL